MIARRTLIAGLPAAGLALATPAAHAAHHPDPNVRFMDAVRELKAAAMALDPTIIGLWVSYQEADSVTAPGQFGQLISIVMNRSAKLQGPRGATT
jgi:hypothetical protein